MVVTFRALLAGALRDRISLFWSVAVPLLLLLVLGSLFPEPAYRRNLVLGLVAFGSLSFAMSGTGFEVMRQRGRGVYKLLRATPFPVAGFVGLLAGARGLITLVGAMLVAGVGSAVHGIDWTPGGILLALPVLAAGTACFTCLGFVLGNLGDNENQVAMYNNLFLLPQMFGSEMFYSLDGAPGWVAAVRRWLPAGRFIDALRAAAGGDGAALVPSLLVLLAMTVLILGLAAATFRWDPGDRRHLPALRRA
ncbi:MAG: ABC transporter permease [Bacillota bacterium]|nr:ABC transporter permease [Bacillota bacterium]